MTEMRTDDRGRLIEALITDAASVSVKRYSGRYVLLVDRAGGKRTLLEFEANCGEVVASVERSDP